ncbi:RHS repeat domain-containing protein [Myroides sp. C15-4]|uniref:RHS repeat domain-containing protein n=1 Tax=Myroides sp. C15-4 TaxID=3400532 RepID=UPI003D2F5747
MYFEYNGAGDRTVMYYGNVATTKEQSLYRRYYSSDGSIEITYNTKNQNIEYVYYVDGDAYNATVIAKGDKANAPQYYYFHRDYLSSIVAITNQVGTIVEKRHFDAWGTAVKIMDGQGQVLNQLTFTDRGYTGHEHLQGINIIQMNGRLYDPQLRRFMAPDNYIQDPSNTQNFNRYGYVWNNPLKYTDPSGEEISFVAAVIIGTVVAMTTYTMTALLADVPFSAEGFTKSAIFGAVSGAVSFGVGQLFQVAQGASTIVTIQQAVGQAIAHGISQGAISAIQGGKFGSSFASAAVSSMLSFGFMEYGGSLGDNSVAMVSFSTVSGGGVSVLTGGNFWEGAVTAFYVSLLNHTAHKMTADGGDQEDPLKKHSSNVKHSLEEWAERYKDMSWKEIATEAGWKQGQPLGPKAEWRYVQAPDGKVMDMRHVVIVGYGYGESVGNLIEHIQNIHSSTRASAFDPQDYYSNRVGAYYYQMRHSGNWSSSSFAYDFKRFIDVYYKVLFSTGKK